jgi:hypothetical protein
MARKIFLMRPVYPRAFRFQHELFPHAAGVFAEHEIGARRLHVPALARELAFQLPRRPAGEARIQAIALPALAEQPLDVVRVHGEINAFQHVKCRSVGWALRAVQRHQNLAHDGAAEVNRVAALFMLFRQRPVENHADRAAIERLGDEHYGLAEVRVGEAGLGHQQYRVGRLLRQRCRYEKKHSEEADHARVRKVIE